MDNELKYTTFREVVNLYENTKEIHRDIYFGFKQNVNRTFYLKRHRDYIVENRHGYGNRAFHWMWKLLVDEMPDDFSLLEIGVFKGQTLNLTSFCAQLSKKTARVYGVTPLDTTDGHPDIDYEAEIVKIYKDFNVPMDNLLIIEGLSTNDTIKQTVTNVSAEQSGFDMIYIDGGHSYDVVKSDIETYIPHLKVGGYLIVDDCSNNLNMPDDICMSYTSPKFQCIGIPDVTRAVEEFVETNPQLTHQFAVGHNRVWKKLKS